MVELTHENIFGPSKRTDHAGPRFLCSARQLDLFLSRSGASDKACRAPHAYIYLSRGPIRHSNTAIIISMFGRSNAACVYTENGTHSSSDAKTQPDWLK